MVSRTKRVVETPLLVGTGIKFFGKLRLTHGRPVRGFTLQINCFLLLEIVYVEPSGPSPLHGPLPIGRSAGSATAGGASSSFSLSLSSINALNSFSGLMRIFGLCDHSSRRLRLSQCICLLKRVGTPPGVYHGSAPVVFHSLLWSRQRRRPPFRKMGVRQGRPVSCRRKPKLRRGLAGGRRLKNFKVPCIPTGRTQAAARIPAVTMSIRTLGIHGPGRVLRAREACEGCGRL